MGDLQQRLIDDDAMLSKHRNSGIAPGRLLPTFLPPPPGKPWGTDSELAMVRNWFYPTRFPPDPYDPPEGDIRQQAISTVHLYIFNDHRLPHALVATAYLTEALVHDEQPHRAKYISNTAMQSLYGMAFIKFVNGFVDRDVAKKIRRDLAAPAVGSDSDHESEDQEGMQRKHETRKVVIKGGGESSMYAHAAKIGMPERYVDVRHQIVHGQIPELWKLKELTEEALEWLWEMWWKVHATGDPGRAMRAREQERLDMEKAREDRERKKRRMSEGSEDEGGGDPVDRIH